MFGYFFKMVKIVQHHLNCKVGHNFNFAKTRVLPIWIAAALIVRHLGSIEFLFGCDWHSGGALFCSATSANKQKNLRYKCSVTLCPKMNHYKC